VRHTVLALALTLLAAAPAAAAPLRAIDRGAAGFDLRTDGTRWIGWSTYVPDFGIPRGSAEFYDVQTGTRLSRQTRDYCYFGALSPDDEILWTCASPVPGEGAIIEDPDGNERVVPPPSGLGADSAGYSALGRFWLRVRNSGYHYGFESYVDRATGRQVQPNERDRGVWFDVDSTGLTRRLCRGMWRPLVPNDDSGRGVVPGPLAIAGRTAAATTFRDSEHGPDGKVVLQRCGKAARVLQRCPQPSLCSQPVINTRIVAWTRLRASKTRLYVRSLQSGRTRSIAVRSTGLMLVGGRLFASVYPGRLVEIAL
jgi:hypothetical protein